MKRILAVCFVFLLLSAAATAQRRSYPYAERVNSITRLERLQLQRDVLRFRVAQRHAERDGILTPYERRELQKLKRKTRREAIRFRYDRRNRVI